MVQTTEIIGCRKTAVKNEPFASIFWEGPGPKPPFTMKELYSPPLMPTRAIFTTFKVFEVHYDKNESKDTVCKCPHCNEEVKILNKKPGFLSHDELSQLEEEYYRTRKPWKVILPLIIIFSWALFILNLDSGPLFMVALFVTVTGGIGTLWAYTSFKNSSENTEQKFGYATLENPVTHGFIVANEPDGGINLSVGYESQQPITPETEIHIVEKKIHSFPDTR